MKQTAKAKERANVKAGNVAVRGWIPADDWCKFAEMTEAAEKAIEAKEPKK
jgi:hypothetical protein